MEKMKYNHRNCPHEFSYRLQEDSFESTDHTAGYRHYKCTVCGAEYGYDTAPMIYEKHPKTGGKVNHQGAQNPYLPGWEHVADAEPHVFWSVDDEEWRVYIYGSHDVNGYGKYCGNNYVVWSAPVYDLGQWRYEGEIFSLDSILFAPDAAYDRMTDTYYLITYEFEKRIGLYRASKPQGKFQDRVFAFDSSYTKFGEFACIDPAIFIEDGRIYLAGTRMGRFSFDIPEKLKQDLQEYHQSMAQFAVIYKMKEDPSKGVEQISYCPNTKRDYLPVYEGVSIRKDPISEKYIMVFCSTEYDAEGRNSTAVTSTLAYVYTDDLMGSWTYGNNGIPSSIIKPEQEEIIGGNEGNVISDTGGRYRKNPRTGKIEYTAEFASYPYDNNHGGMERINGKWYMFSHRFTSRQKGARQGTIEPLELNYSKDKDCLIIQPTEMTSSGAADCLDAYKEISARSACWLTPGIYEVAYNGSDKSEENVYRGPYIEFNNQDREAEHASCISGIEDGSVVGFKYIDFGEKQKETKLLLLVKPSLETDKVRIEVRIDAPTEEEGEKLTDYTLNLKEKADEWNWCHIDMEKMPEGCHALYLVFYSDRKQSELLKLDAIKFVR